MTKHYRLLFIIALLIIFSFSMAQDATEETATQSEPVFFPNEDCLSCHDSEDMKENYVTVKHLEGSLHEGLNCMDCHTNITELPHAEDLKPKDCLSCTECHSDVGSAYEKHGWKSTDECEDIPKCYDCHGSHQVLPADNPKSMVSPRNLPETCGKCHEDTNFVKKHKIAFREPAVSYLKSVHGKATSGGVEMAASCNDCHTTEGNPHDIRPPGDPESSINFFKINKTCGHCHRIVEDEYNEGIHGQLVNRGEVDSPNCTSCHGRHNILANEDPHSTVNPNRVAREVCGPCHESERIRERYGVAGSRLSSYVDSYHGLKSSVGDITVATCASCHGPHHNFPADDPRSSIYPANRMTTCGKCHSNITEKMAMTPIHQEGTRFETPVAHVIRIIYFLLIVVTITGMFLHNFFDIRYWYKKSHTKKQVVRMQPSETMQHAFLTLTFTLLVITGFALRHSESFWAQWIFGWETGFSVRGIIHRVAAIGLLLTTIWHCWYVTTTRGKQFFKDMKPTKQDFIDFWVNAKRLIGISDEFPKFGRFTYGEKFEYWALIWGTAIMAITGLMLWFDNEIVKLIPKGFLDVALVIHYYEALLATLAVIVWHFYNVLFNPVVYPMNTSWITGKMPYDVYKHEHPGDTSVVEE